jgi:hypothetical protein
MAIKFGTRNASVEMSDTFQRMARRISDRVQPGVLERLEDEQGSIHRQALGQWPVKTGRSLAALELVTRVSAGRDAVGVAIRNPVDYVRFIKSAATKGRNPWNELIAKPVRKMVRRLTRTEAKKIAEALEGG